VWGGGQEIIFAPLSGATEDAVTPQEMIFTVDKVTTHELAAIPIRKLESSKKIHPF